MTPATLPQPPLVRTPFRWPAGVCFAIVVVLICMMPWVIWRRGTQVAVLHGVVVLPALLRGGHLAWHATVRSPPHASWPFATPRVALGYFLILILISIFAAQLNR
jgi:hypothetical protein